MGNRVNIFLNYSSYFLIVVFFAVIQSVLLNKFIFFSPMLLLLPVIYFGKTRNFFEGIILSFIIGYIFHLHSAVNEIVSNFYFIFIFVFAKYLCSMFSVTEFINKIYYIFSCSMLYFVLLFFWNFTYTSASIWKMLFSGFLSSIVLSLIGVYIFNFFRFVDFKTKFKIYETIEEFKRVK